MTHAHPTQTATPEPYAAAAPVPAKSKALGMVAFFIALAVFIVSLIVSALNGVAAAPFTDTSGNGFNYNTDLSSSDPAEVAVGLATMAHILIGSLAGIAALVLGIIAAVSNRGRGFGIAAAIIAFLAPGLSLVTFFVVLALSV
jgi:hypothetical protein